MIAQEQVNKKLDEVNKTLDLRYQESLAIGRVLAAHQLRINKEGALELDKGVILDTIYSDKGTISIVKFSKVGSRYPDHKHLESVQYLICVAGSFSVSFGGNFRLLKVPGCVAVPERIIHSITALEDNSEMIAICVPEEEIYKLNMGTKGE